jgi:hypothetical protein
MTGSLNNCEYEIEIKSDQSCGVYAWSVQRETSFDVDHKLRRDRESALNK